VSYEGLIVALFGLFLFVALNYFAH